MVPVILSGGGGTRLWPVSRPSMPKQFCELLDESLFAKTAKRLMPLGEPWVITVREMQSLTERALKELGLPTDQVILEPFGKNTAPAIALVCRQFELLGKSDEIVGIFPADHLVDDEEKFREIVRAGEAFAKAGHVVTLGIKPTYPATGYGYIETSGSVTLEDSTAVRATGFREKPNAVTAREFLDRGAFYWNAGMFIFRVATMIELFQKYANEIWTVVANLKADLSNIEDIYASVKSISIDYAIMERLPSHVCLACEFGWNDLGSWDSIAEVIGDKNRSSKPVEVHGADNFVFGTGTKLVAFVGVSDLIVVDTPDALLIAEKGKTELVKDLVSALQR